MREFIHTEPGEPGSWRPSLQEIHSEMRVEYERCLEREAPVVFLQIGIEGIERIEQVRGSEGKELVLRAVTELVRSAPRNGDLHSYRDPGGLVVMLTEAPAESGELLARILVESARQLELPDDRGTMRLNLCIGLAATQQDEEFFFETMLEVAQEGSTVASASGGGCFAHTQLYGLHQRRLEREMPDRKLVSVARKERQQQQERERMLRQKQRIQQDTSTPDSLPATNGTAHGVDAQHGADELAPVAVPESVDFESEMSTLHGRLRDVLAADRTARGVQATPESSAQIEEQVMDLADRWVQAVLRKALEAQAAEHRMETALLERRIHKLDEALQDSERELHRLARAKSVDDGLHSAYRNVQGLNAHEENFETKNALMEQLLAANLELYSQISLNN